MIEHVKIFLFILLVIWNFWLIIYFNQLNKSYRYTFLKKINTLIITYFVFYILGFIRMYLLENLNELLYIDWIGFIELIWYLLRIWVIYLIIEIMLSFREIHFSKKSKRWINSTAFIILIAYTLKFFYPHLNAYYLVPDFIFDILERYHEIIKILILFSFCFFWNKLTPYDKTIKISRYFSLFFIISYSFSISVDILITNSDTSELLQVLYVTIKWSLFLLAPMLWIQYIFYPYANSLKELLYQKTLFESVYAKYDISKREQEIIELIIDGKSNSQIKDHLYISYHTVKNHISNIYKKLNIKTRHELVHLLLKEKESK